METLPEDVILNILSRLPAKLVTRLKIVCKLGYHLINNPDFMKLHLERSLATQSIESNLHFVIKTPLLHLADFDTFDNPIELDYPFKNPFTGGVIVIGSCHGLLCCRKDGCHFSVFLYNPTTQTHKMLPFIPRTFEFDFICRFGFGYDSFSGDYKCVRIVHFWSKDRLSIESEVTVYSLKEDSWRRVQDLPCNIYFRTPSAFVGRAIHWVSEDVHKVNLSIVSFDLKYESYGSIAFPHFDDERDHIHMSVGVLDSCLCLLDNEIEFCDVWIMKEYGQHESWMKLFSIRKRMATEHLERIVSFSITKKEMLLKLFFDETIKLDLETMEVTNVKVVDFHSCLDTWVCVENLVILNDECHDSVSEQEHGRKKSKKNKNKKKKKENKRRLT